jgi:tetratricopeptide (TPR) repeat protein
MTEHDELRDALTQADRMPYGPARSSLVELTLTRAEALDDPRLVFDARTELVECFTMGAEQAKAFAVFAGCLADYDGGRISFTDRDAKTLRWQHKWVVSAMPKFPSISREQMLDALDDMRRRFLAAGQSLHAIHNLAVWVHRNLGDREAAEEAYGLWVTSPRDGNSDARHGDASSKADHHLWMGRYDEALEHAAPVMDGRLTGGKDPQETLAAMLPAMLETGRWDAAREAHLRAYRLHRGDLHSGPYIAEHLHFCARTGNEARGLEILTRHQRWYDQPTDPRTELGLAASSVLLLRRLEKTGPAGLTVHRRAFGSRRSGAMAIDELRDQLERRARLLAAQFDTRNGNQHESDRVERRMAAEPHVSKIHLSAVDRFTTSATAAPADRDFAGLARSADEQWATAGIHGKATLEYALTAVQHWQQTQDRAGRAIAELHLGTTYHHRGNWLDAAEALEMARYDFEQIALVDTPDVRQTYELLAECQTNLGEHVDAAATFGEIASRASSAAPGWTKPARRS